jgi:hypothetical protein
MTLKAQFEERERQWRLFHDWEEAQLPADRPLADIFADLGAVWSWLPEEVRLADPDPEKHGVRAYHAALGKLRR